MKNRSHVKYDFLAYKKGSSCLHKCPTWIKLLLIPVISITFLCLPPQCAVCFSIFQFLLACFLHFSLREQLKDIKPVFLYVVILIIFKVILEISGGNFDFKTDFSWENSKETVFLLVKLVTVLQSTALLFRTTTSLELREGISSIENAVRNVFHLKGKNTFTDTVFLFLNFIPMVSKIWEESKKAYLARGGKNSPKMYVKLLLVLFCVGIKKACNQAKAIEIRTPDEPELLHSEE